VAEVDMRTAFRDAFAAVPNARADWLIDERAAAQSRQAIMSQQNEAAQMQQVGQTAEVAGQAAQAAQQVQAALNA